MEVEKPGFKTVIKPAINLHVQDVLEVNFEMALGSVAESVTVKARAPAIQLATSSINAVVKLDHGSGIAAHRTVLGRLGHSPAWSGCDPDPTNFTGSAD